MISCSITKDGMSKSKVDRCGVWSWRVKADSVGCAQCGEWIHSRCDAVKRVTSNVPINATCRKCEGNIREAVEQEVMLCDDVEAVREFTYLGDRVSACVGCEAAMTARTRCGWAKQRECVELLHGRKYHLRLKWAVHRSYAWPVILY